VSDTLDVLDRALVASLASAVVKKLQKGRVPAEETFRSVTSTQVPRGNEERLHGSRTSVTTTAEEVTETT
jgi:hypothetical protein